MTPFRAALLGGVIIAFTTGALLNQVSHRLARKEVESDLATVAERILARSEAVVEESLRAMQPLQDVPASAACSPLAMERYAATLAVTHRLRAIGGLEEGGLACVNVAGRERRAKLPVPIWTDGRHSVWLEVGGQLGLPEQTAVFSKGAVFAAFDPFFLVEAVLKEQLRIEVALFELSSGRLIAATGMREDIGRMAAARLSSIPVENGDEIFVARRHASAPAVVVVSRPALSGLAHWRNEGWVWFAVAVLFGIAGGAGVGAATRRYVSIEAQMRRALARREFVPWYQPIVELGTGRCVGAEALVRWMKSDGTMVRPDLFIPLAEETGLVQPLTDQVLERVVSEMGPVLRAVPLYISVNLSASDVAATRVLRLAQRLLPAAGIPAGRIAFEATERGFADVASARQALREYRNNGHRILIDDFGTGYSSLAQLQSLEVDAIKIDKSFVDAIGQEGATRSVVPHIIAMARELQLDVVAEGIETELQRSYLHERSVRYGQGWLFARAMPAQAFRGWLETQGRA